MIRMGLILLAAAAAFGQTFDAASIKPAAETPGSTFLFTHGGGLEVKNGTLRGLIEMAYDVRDFQISGGPGWLDATTYDVVAKGGPETVPEKRLELQALLVERFQLQVHRETKELPVFELVVGKKGPHLKEAETAEGPSGIRGECGKMTGIHATMVSLAFGLSRQMGRPVLDRTALPGKYDFQVEYTPDSGPCAETATGPSLVTALQEQIGLKLEPTKGPVEVIVIDRAEKAAGN
jgi:uncharacterized protein (TIGR03435 family)